MRFSKFIQHRYSLKYQPLGCSNTRHRTENIMNIDKVKGQFPEARGLFIYFLSLNSVTNGVPLGLAGEMSMVKPEDPWRKKETHIITHVNNTVMFADYSTFPRGCQNKCGLVISEPTHTFPCVLFCAYVNWCFVRTELAWSLKRLRLR